MFRAKKALASKIGDTKAGRTTLIKVAGEDSAHLLEALKDAMTKFEDKATAKELKRLTLKLIMKVSLLWEHKDLTPEKMTDLKRPCQMAAELFLHNCSKEPGTRDPSSHIVEAHRVEEILVTILAPHMKEKNSEIIRTITEGYCDVAFMTKLMNDPEYAEDCEVVVASLTKMLLPFPRVLDDEQSAKEGMVRAQYCNRFATDRLPMFLDYPELGQILQGYLDTFEGGKLAHDLRFVLAVKDFSQISAANIRKTRGPMTFKKFLLEGAKFSVSVDPSVVSELKEVMDAAQYGGGSVRAGVFSAALACVMSRLELVFETQFMATKAYAQLKGEREAEFDELKSRFGEFWRDADAAKASARQTQLGAGAKAAAPPPKAP